MPTLQVYVVDRTVCLRDSKSVVREEPVAERKFAIVKRRRFEDEWCVNTGLIVRTTQKVTVYVTPVTRERIK